MDDHLSELLLFELGHSGDACIRRYLESRLCLVKICFHEPVSLQ